MLRKSPFHERTAQLCTSMNWKDWAGYYAVNSYDTGHEQEYFAYRHAAGLMDATPLFKYEVKGPDSASLLSRIMARDITKLRRGRVNIAVGAMTTARFLMMEPFPTLKKIITVLLPPSPFCIGLNKMDVLLTWLSVT